MRIPSLIAELLKFNIRERRLWIPWAASCPPPAALRSVPLWPNSCTGLSHGPPPPPCHTQQPLSQAQKSPWQRGIRQPPALFLSRVLSISSQKTPLLQGFNHRMPTSDRKALLRFARKVGGASLKREKSARQSSHTLLCLAFYLLLSVTLAALSKNQNSLGNPAGLCTGDEPPWTNTGVQIDSKQGTH